jgi:hypothetical protein
MSADDLAAELLTTVLDADPLSGSLYGFPGYDDLLPDFSDAAETEQAKRLTSVAVRAEQMPDEGLGETELQTLDFVRVLARQMADAAAVPATEFTISDTFATPVCAVLTMLPKVRLDTKKGARGTSPACAACPTCWRPRHSDTGQAPPPAGRPWRDWWNPRSSNWIS